MAGRDPLGRGALYSASSGRRPGTAVVHCSSCGARTRVGVGELIRRHLPFWLWIPGRRFPVLLSCPACERRTWVAVDLFG